MQKLQAFRDSSGVSGGDGTAEEDVLFLTDPIPDEIHVAAEAASGLEPASHQYDLLLITKDAGLWERLSAHFAEEGQFKLRQLQGRVAEHEARVADIKLPDIALIDLNKGDMLDINALERLKRSRFSNVPIVATSSCLDQTLVRGLMRIKVDDWLPADSMPAEIQRSCEKALRMRSAEEEARHAKCTTFLPAIGGSGNTTLAIQTAFLLGSRKKQMQSVCLVDLNFQDGAAAEYLDLSPSFQLAELSNVSGRLDRQMLDVMLTSHRSGLSVLAAPRVPGRFVDIGEGLIASILGLLSESFEHLVIDLPKNWYPWTDNVIWGSDRIFIVANFTIPALRQARFVADAIAAKASPEAEISVIVNKFHEPLMGPGLSRKDAESILAGRLAGVIPNLGGVVDDAINRGMMLSEIRAGNKVEKQLLKILDQDARIAKTQNN